MCPWGSASQLMWGTVRQGKAFPHQLGLQCSRTSRSLYVGLVPTSQGRRLQEQICLCCGSEGVSILPTACVLLVASAEAVYCIVYLQKAHVPVLFRF